MNILDQDIMYLPGVGPHRKEILGKELNIQSWRDLIEYFPYKYVDRSRIYTIREMTGDMPFVQLKGKILRFEEFELGPRKKRIVAHFSDGTGIVDIVWFNGGKYIYDHYKTGVDYILFGRPTIYAGRYQFAHPDIQPAAGLELSSMGMQPYYITTERMKKSGLMSHNVEKITKNLVERIPQGSIAETLPPFITSRLHLMGREEALRKIHYPKDVRDVQNAQARLKFEELFYVQLNILRYASDHRRKYRGCVMRHVGQLFNGFYFNHLPFPLTNAQKRVMHEIRADLVSGQQMNRLLQGDVGSGKTLVALMAMLLAIDNGYQACLMAPTEILAEQHLQTLRGFLGNLPVRVELLTGIVKGKRRKEVLDALLSGQINILVGTHAVLEDNVQFRRLGMAVIDEQHRFGVAQRAKLWGKSENPPHVLVMTATPIPRTLAMILYCDLDISVIDELPKGRKPVETYAVGTGMRTRVYKFIAEEVASGHQAYIVCPLAENDDPENQPDELASAREYADSLRNTPLAETRVAYIHGKMKPSEKDRIMTD
ncbi:MAG: ATP-dependent DNA helicase RecG, partial [Prevotella sp.]|nr:ATP-dependent DNA helicase RecG [Prevotella sp.]